MFQDGHYQGNLIPDPPPDPQHDPRYDPRYDPSKDENRDKSSFTWRQVVIFIILFILMLAGITIVESIVKTQRLRLQKQRVAEAVCIANDLNGADAELDNCIEVYMALSESFEAGEPPGAAAARISEGISAEEVRKVVKVWLAVQLKE